MRRGSMLGQSAETANDLRDEKDSTVSDGRRASLLRSRVGNSRRDDGIVNSPSQADEYYSVGKKTVEKLLRELNPQKPFENARDLYMALHSLTYAATAYESEGRLDDAQMAWRIISSANHQLSLDAQAQAQRLQALNDVVLPVASANDFSQRLCSMTRPHSARGRRPSQTGTDDPFNAVNAAPNFGS